MNGVAVLVCLMITARQKRIVERHFVEGGNDGERLEE
jgi:hypothetical protein